MAGLLPRIAARIRLRVAGDYIPRPRPARRSGPGRRRDFLTQVSDRAQRTVIAFCALAHACCYARRLSVNCSWNEVPMSESAPLCDLQPARRGRRARCRAGVLVESRMAACVNVLRRALGLSLAGRDRHGDRNPPLIKTSARRYAALEAAIRKHHPYELPEIIAVPVTHGLPDYLAWVASRNHPE